MLENLGELLTEGRNEHPESLDTWSSLEIVKRMNREDALVADAVSNRLEEISQAVDLITNALDNGGRLLYFGAGTSGRLGVLDASECPPTFGTDPELVQGVIAGGTEALFTAIEGAEDSEEGGEQDVRARDVGAGDVVVGIAASGRTPYVIGALRAARAAGASTVAVACNTPSEIGRHADIAIEVPVGPEVVSGSTRLKAGTAQKLVLNMLTTGAMIRLGKVYDDLMVNLQATNKKLQERAKRIVAAATGLTAEEAEHVLAAAEGDCKTAIVMQKCSIDAESARELLVRSRGRVRAAVEAGLEGGGAE